MRFAARHHSDVDAQLGGQAGQLGVEVLRGILESGEHQQLAVGVAIPVGGGAFNLVADGLLDGGQLAVPFRADGFDLA